MSSIEIYEDAREGQVGGRQWNEIGRLIYPVVRCAAVNIQGLIVVVGETGIPNVPCYVQTFELSTGTAAILTFQLGGKGLKAFNWTDDTAFFADQSGQTHRLTFRQPPFRNEWNFILFNQFHTRRPFAVLKEEGTDNVVVIYSPPGARGSVVVACYHYQGNTQAVGARWFGVTHVGIYEIGDAFQVKLHGPFHLSPR